MATNVFKCALPLIAVLLGGCTQVHIDGNSGPVTVYVTLTPMTMAIIPVSAIPGLP